MYTEFLESVAFVSCDLWTPEGDAPEDITRVLQGGSTAAGSANDYVLGAVNASVVHVHSCNQLEVLLRMLPGEGVWSRRNQGEDRFSTNHLRRSSYIWPPSPLGTDGSATSDANSRRSCQGLGNTSSSIQMKKSSLRNKSVISVKEEVTIISCGNPAAAIAVP